MEPIDLTVDFNGTWDCKNSIRLKEAFNFSENHQSKLSDHILTMVGGSGQRYRRLINKFVELTQDPRYLEIGSWAGSTACSAMYGNKCKITCIDNWSEFGGPKDQFFSNVNISKNENVDFSFIESDYVNVDYSTIDKFNIYLFDGPHEEHQQYSGITIAQPALDDSYLLIVDDWNWGRVRNGTLNALRDIDSKIVSSITVRTTQNETHPTVAGPDSDWHNGYFIAVINK